LTVEGNADRSRLLRLAFATDDGQTISSHFGQARSYRVMQIDDGRRTDLGLRPKAHHGLGDHEPSLHGSMLESITDCQVLIAGGMGAPAREKALAAGLEVILAGGKIEDAVAAFSAGTLVSDDRRLHQHGH
jgi:predicted Fe-Mo cluster-binding NifX family protein